MAEDGIKDFTINWVLGGFLMFCLLTFSISFMYNNNPTGLDDGTGDVFDSAYSDKSSSLTALAESSDSILNVTANTNPETSELGSRDSVSVAFDSKRTASENFKDSKKLISWVFSGTSGTVLLGVISGIVGFLSVFYIWRFIRNGT